jgi:glyoxylase-like metal-dependent hydrolase (beta-lactamase superfamily II)
VRTPDIVVKGKNNGEGMAVHYRTTKGTDIFGLGVPNIHINSDWDLGPTWCYLILGQKTTLIDTGRFGNFHALKSLLNSISKDISDIDTVIMTHSHDDHDGNLAEVLSESQATLWAHSIYPPMIQYHPELDDGAPYPGFPGSCRQCIVPKKMNKNCIEYQKARSVVSVNSVFDEDTDLPDNIRLIFTPGHTPDSICIILENEVIFTGDTLLPDITPHPSLCKEFMSNRSILPEQYRRENTVYGLLNYVKSLGKIIRLNSPPLEAAFTAHRLFFKGRFNIIHDPSLRAREIIRFHIDRCLEILRIAGNGPVDINTVVIRHFSSGLLKGIGKQLAHYEIIAHLELMEESEDIRWVGDNKDLIESTGSQNFIDVFKKYL